jgi:hypothetical protein
MGVLLWGPRTMELSALPESTGLHWLFEQCLGYRRHDVPAPPHGHPAPAAPGGHVVVARLRALGAEQFADVGQPGTASLREVSGWHPSEESGLLAAAVNGHRGLVEVRDAGDQVELNGETAALYAADAEVALAAAPAALLSGSRSLAHAQAVIRDATGISEIDYETKKAHQMLYV